MNSKQIIIKNKTGLHARPAAQFVQKASQYQSQIELVYQGKKVNGKSIMGVMSLGAAKGSKIEIKASGEDEEKAVKELVDFIEELAKEDEE